MEIYLIEPNYIPAIKDRKAYRGSMESRAKAQIARWDKFEPHPMAYCKGCMVTEREMCMEIYDAANDEYFHNQDCMDAANGIFRRPCGAIFHGKRYRNGES